VIDLVLPILQLLGVFSIFPVFAFSMANNAGTDASFIILFKRPDSPMLFTNEKLMELRLRYEIEYKMRCWQAMLFTLVVVLCLIYLGNNPAKGNEAAGVVFAIVYVFSSLYVFAWLGASNARLGATKPLNKYQRDEMERIIINSDSPEELVRHINMNPKETLAYIDVLNLKYQAKKMANKHNEAKSSNALNGLKK
jgi:hypothetical protein